MKFKRIKDENGNEIEDLYLYNQINFLAVANLIKDGFKNSYIDNNKIFSVAPKYEIEKAVMSAKKEIHKFNKAVEKKYINRQGFIFGNLKA
jgi:hypothetical protein